jgi:hypothetical protein
MYSIVLKTVNFTLLKGKLSPDIGLNLEIYKIKSVLSVGPLMVFIIFFYCVVLGYLKGQ